LLNDETDPLVRKRLYQALAHQESFDLNAVWTQTVNEREPGARIAGLDLFARTVQQSPSPEMIAFFDEHALPELKSAVLNSNNRDERIWSLMVLRRSRTANSIAALREIVQQTGDAAVASAAGVALGAAARR